MKRSILFLAIIAIASCTKKSNSGTSVPTAPNPYLTFSLPYIDTATLWNVNGSGNRTGGKATISAAGVLAITGYHTPGGIFANGTYLMQLLDTGYTTRAVGIVWFNLYQYGPDSVISTGNVLQLNSSGMRPYYSLEISGGHLPPFAIVSGEFIDSL